MQANKLKSLNIKENNILRYKNDYILEKRKKEKNYNLR